MSNPATATAPAPPSPDTQDQVPQEHVVEWTRAGTMERVVCRGASAEDRAHEWFVKMGNEGVSPLQYNRAEDPNAQYPAAVHVGGPTVTLCLGQEYRDLSKGEDVASTFFEGANATERATEFSARAKERAAY